MKRTNVEEEYRLLREVITRVTGNLEAAAGAWTSPAPACDESFVQVAEKRNVVEDYRQAVIAKFDSQPPTSCIFFSVECGSHSVASAFDLLSLGNKNLRITSSNEEVTSCSYIKKHQLI